MIPEISTIDICDCLVYDPDSVEEYVGSLKERIADLEAQLASQRAATLEGKFMIARSDGFNLGALNTTPRRISATWTPQTDVPLLNYAEARQIVKFLEKHKCFEEYGPNGKLTYRLVKVIPKKDEDCIYNLRRPDGQYARRYDYLTGTISTWTNDVDLAAPFSYYNALETVDNFNAKLTDEAQRKMLELTAVKYEQHL